MTTELAAQIAMFLIPAVVIAFADYGKLNPGRFIGVYLVASAAMILASYLATGSLVASLFTLLASIAGAVIGVLLMGFLGTKVSNRSYLALGSALGLFPWWISNTASLVYGAVVAISLIAAILLSLARKNSIKGIEQKPRIFMGGIAAVVAAGSIISLF